MNKLIVATTALGTLALTACDTSKCDTGACDTYVDDDTGDTTGDSGDIYDGPTYIDQAGADCDAGKALYWFDVVTVGLASEGDIWIDQDTKNAWDEYHPLPVWSSDDNGWETILYQELEIVSSANDQVEGSSTLFKCNSSREATLGFLVYVYDDTGAYADCVRWGSASSLFSADCKNAI